MTSPLIFLDSENSVSEVKTTDGSKNHPSLSGLYHWTVFDSLAPYMGVENCNDENIYEVPYRVHYPPRYSRR